jgi:hypothetical protein
VWLVGVGILVFIEPSRDQIVFYDYRRLLTVEIYLDTTKLQSESVNTVVLENTRLKRKEGF